MLTKEIFSMRLRELKQSYSYRDVTLKEIANALGVHYGTCREYFCGRNLPSTESAIKLADYFAVSLNFLIKGENYDH